MYYGERRDGIIAGGLDRGYYTSWSGNKGICSVGLVSPHCLLRTSKTQ